MTHHVSKFKEATEALYQGESDRAAELFGEAVTAAAEGVKQDLLQRPALEQLFADYPEIREKKAYAMMADEYVDAFVTNGDPIDVAIRKAGDTVAEEYGLGKFARQPSRGHKSTDDSGERRVIADMAAARPGATDAATQYDQVHDEQDGALIDVIAEMAAARSASGRTQDDDH